MVRRSKANLSSYKGKQTQIWKNIKTWISGNRKTVGTHAFAVKKGACYWHLRKVRKGNLGQKMIEKHKNRPPMQGVALSSPSFPSLCPHSLSPPLLFLSLSLSLSLSFFPSFLLFFFFWPHPQHMEVPRLGVIAASLQHSHSNTKSEPYLRPTPQLMEIPDP